MNIWTRVVRREGEEALVQVLLLADNEEPVITKGDKDNPFVMRVHTPDLA